MSADAKKATVEVAVERLAAEAKGRYEAICARLGPLSESVWYYVVRPQAEGQVHERGLWARLVKAERAWHDQTVALDGERDRDMKGAYAEVDAARKALRDLGVESYCFSDEP